ncbi:hypothetical protein HMSSN139_25870 [Paenibacillus sp. HMSSN-139]|nr:hypothetical protein HMSSN139_25870 [Paenibacillus sp. HMSSN-139]
MSKWGFFFSFTELLDRSVQNLWQKLLSELSRCEVMLDEIQSSSDLPQDRKGFAYFRIMETGSSEDKDTLSARKVAERDWTLMLVKYNIKEQLLSMLHQSVDHVQSLLHECKKETVRTELKSILEPFIAVLSPARRSVQEG